MKWIIAGLVVIGTLIVLTQGLFVVKPDQFAIVTEFGKPVHEIKEPGLNFKIPFVQEVIYLDRRVRGWDDEGKDVKTKELKPIAFIAFARWRIAEPLRYYERVRDEKRAAANMDSVVTARIQAKVREKKLGELVRNQKREFGAQEKLDLQNLIARFEECNPDPVCVFGQPDDEMCAFRGGCNPEACKPGCAEGQVCVPGNLEIRDQIAEKQLGGRTTDEGAPQRREIVTAILDESNAVLRSEFGIEILDLHFKYLNLAPTVHEDVIRRIRADREADIATYRRVGKACRGAILQGKEQRLGDIIGERDRRVRLEKGLAQAKAIQVKQEAFLKDPEFFRFMKTLEVYENSLGSDTRMVMSSDNPLLALMRDSTLLDPIKATSATASPTRGANAIAPPKAPVRKVPAVKAAPPKAPAPAPVAPEPTPEAPKAPAPE